MIYRRDFRGLNFAIAIIVNPDEFEQYVFTAIEGFDLAKVAYGLRDAYYVSANTVIRYVRQWLRRARAEGNADFIEFLRTSINLIRDERVRSRLRDAYADIIMRIHGRERG